MAECINSSTSPEAGQLVQEGARLLGIIRQKDREIQALEINLQESIRIMRDINNRYQRITSETHPAIASRIFEIGKNKASEIELSCDRGAFEKVDREKMAALDELVQIIPNLAEVARNGHETAKKVLKNILEYFQV